MARPTLLTSAIGMRMLEHRSGHLVVRMLGRRVVIGALCIALVETVMLADIAGAYAQTPRNEETIAVRLGGHQFEIPAGYFLTVRPVRPETDSILITALMPDMEPMRDNNKEEFLYERGFGKHRVYFDRRRPSHYVRPISIARRRRDRKSVCPAA